MWNCFAFLFFLPFCVPLFHLSVILGYKYINFDLHVDFCVCTKKMIHWLFVANMTSPLSLFSQRSLRQFSAVISLLMTSSLSPALETKRLRSTKSSTELWLVEKKNPLIKSGVEAKASSCTNGCTEHRWHRKRETRNSYFVLLFTFVKEMRDKEKQGGTKSHLWKKKNCF